MIVLKSSFPRDYHLALTKMKGNRGAYSWEKIPEEIVSNMYLKIGVLN